MRRPKPLIALITTPHRASANKRKSLSARPATRALTRIDSASTGAAIAIPTSDTTSCVVSFFFIRSSRSFLSTAMTITSTVPLGLSYQSPMNPQFSALPLDLRCRPRLTRLRDGSQGQLSPSRKKRGWSGVESLSPTVDKSTCPIRSRATTRAPKQRKKHPSSRSNAFEACRLLRFGLCW